MSPAPAPQRPVRLTPLRGFVAVFLAVFLLVFLTSALITFSLPKTFVAVARVRVTSDRQSDIFQSQAVLTRVSEELDFPGVLARRFGQSEPFPADRTLETLRRSLQVRLVRGTQLAEIRAASRSADEAALLANAVAKAGLAGLRTSGQAQRSLGGEALIEEAVAPRVAARPNTILNLALGALVGSVLGILAGGVGARLAVGVDPEQRRA